MPEQNMKDKFPLTIYMDADIAKRLAVAAEAQEREAAELVVDASIGICRDRRPAAARRRYRIRRQQANRRGKTTIDENQGIYYRFVFWQRACHSTRGLMPADRRSAEWGIVAIRNRAEGCGVCIMPEGIVSSINDGQKVAQAFGSRTRCHQMVSSLLSTP